MHPYIPELREQFAQGKITRREFLRFAALLGLSLPAASSMIAGCAPAAQPAQPTAAAPAAGTPKRGGELRVAAPVQKFTDPAATQWFENNIYREVCEYLVLTSQDGLTAPWLLEKWEPSADLKTWTLTLRKGIKFNHGPEFTADDVVFNINRWVDPKSTSSMKSLVGAYLAASGIEKKDAYTVVLHLDKAQVGVPEHLFQYTAPMLPKDWQGDWIKQPYGTGPFTLQEYVVDERVLLKKRDGYWKNGSDGKALPYLDAIRFVNMGTDEAPAVASLTTGQIHVMWRPSLPSVKQLEGASNVTLAIQTSSSTHIYRMRADKKPFDDVRVRQAVKMCQDRQRILDATEAGRGAIGADFHTSPVHPEYSPLDPPKRDTDKAKALIKDAGYANGVDVTLSVLDGEPNLTMAQLIKEQCAPAGINIKLETMPSAMYWERWLEFDFGITSWAHRPLASMTADLAYRAGAQWNETHWNNPEYDKLLDQVNATYDLTARKKAMGQMEKIQQEQGTIGLPRFRAMIHGHLKTFKNFRACPADYMFLWDTWLE
jgi:peptide/nickel transport system substrate-binding protein